MTYQDYFNGVDINKIAELEEFFQARNVMISEKVVDLAKRMVNMKVLSTSQGDFYIYRQNLVSERFNCMRLANIFLKQLKKLRKDVARAYKFGEKSEIATDTQTKLTNNDERDLWFSSDLRDYEYRLKVVDNHIAFIIESIENVKNMIYGFEMVKELQSYNNSI